MMNKDFLLQNEVGKELFTKFATDQPIIDYHCHLSPKEIYENKQYENLTQVWLNNNGAGDHYKWRLMRANGVPEELISGNGNDFDKFMAFVKTVEKAPGNPIFEWSHLELSRYFGIELTINEKNAHTIWELANKKLKTDAYRPKELLEMMKVKAVCTTDDPADDLKYHKALAKAGSSIKVLPTFRADKSWTINVPDYKGYIIKLSEASEINIDSFERLKDALTNRVQYFHSIGGRLADQGLNKFFFVESTDKELDEIFNRAINGDNNFDEDEINAFVTAIQLHLMKQYTKNNWTMQMHMNALRNDSTKLFTNIGVDIGGDSMGDQSSITSNIVSLFDAAERNHVLPKTILYSLNPNDWLPLATAMQSFQGGIIQKLQLGCAWWFNDTYEGMKEQLTVMAEQSLLANFTGMLTDSRSFLSFPRHEYFRRVLCQLVGEWVSQGRVPYDLDYLGEIIKNICYGNAYKYFGFFDN